jgi:hypothetical protein
MSDIKRYRFDGVDLVGGYSDGKWVKYEDHLAQIERFRSERDILKWAAREWLYEFPWNSGSPLYTDEQIAAVAALVGEEAER